MPEPTVLTHREAELIAGYRKLNREQKNVLLVHSYHLSGKPWTDAMKHQLEMLGALIATA